MHVDKDAVAAGYHISDVLLQVRNHAHLCHHHLKNRNYIAR